MENEQREDAFAKLQKVWAAFSILMLMLGMLLGQIMAQFSLASNQPAQSSISYIQPSEEIPPEYLLPASQERDPEQAGPLEQTGQPGLRTLLANIPKADSAARLLTPNYAEDRAIREAILARSTQWQAELSTSTLLFNSSNRLQVYLGNPGGPELIGEMQTLLSTRREHTILTARILLGLWQSRRGDVRYSNGDSVAVRVDEILAWRGVQKHQRVAYPGAKKRFSDGYQWKHKQQVYSDLRLLQYFFVRGQHTIVAQGKAQQYPVNSPYLHLTFLKGMTPCEKEITGCLVSPGDWIDSYKARGNLFLAAIDRRIFQLNPQNDQIALRVALYLTERWRQQTRKNAHTDPVIMADLLAASMVPIDKANLTSRFAPRVEAALLKLYQQGILGVAPANLSPLDKTKAQWGNDWLASRWLLLPPQGTL